MPDVHRNDNISCSSLPHPCVPRDPGLEILPWSLLNELIFIDPFSSDIKHCFLNNLLSFIIHFIWPYFIRPFLTWIFLIRPFLLFSFNSLSVDLFHLTFSRSTLSISQICPLQAINFVICHLLISLMSKQNVFFF